MTRPLAGGGGGRLTRLKINRRVALDLTREPGNEAGGTVVHLEGYGLIRVFRIDSRDGDTEHWATDIQTMDELTRVGLADRTWAIENYHRGSKQCCGVERCQARAGRSQRSHIGMAIRAFLRLERHF